MHPPRMPPAAAQPGATILAKPLAFAAIILGFYSALLLPILLHHGGDPSVFVVAGDRFVDRLATPSPIVVAPHSSGYDGQFSYALAVHPFTASPVTAGVTFDHSAWRGQRILYPLLAHLIAGCAPSLVPAALLALNLAALFAVATLVAHQARNAAHGMLAAVAILLWPGFLTTLSHDTSELLACALLLAAITAYAAGRLLPFALLGMLATLSRETTSLMLAGIVLANLPAILSVSRKNLPLRAAAPAAAAAAALIPVVVWHAWLFAHWHGTPDTVPPHPDLGLPFAGLIERLSTSLAGLITPQHVSTGSRLFNLYEVSIAIFIPAITARMATAANAARAGGGAIAHIAVGWGLMAILITLLSAKGGPWVDPTAILRVFGECWVAGWFLILRGPAAGPPWLSLLTLAPMAAVNAALWIKVLK